MDKAKVINALRCCAYGACHDCPYDGMENCDMEMCSDAIALIKANEPIATATEPSASPKYTLVNIYTKRSDLSDYLSARMVMEANSVEQAKRMREYYAQEREVQLIAMFRWEHAKCFCKIKCPINTLPVKGEFEVPSTGVLDRFLKKDGWTFKQKLYPCMFK